MEPLWISKIFPKIFWEFFVFVCVGVVIPKNF